MASKVVSSPTVKTTPRVSKPKAPVSRATRPVARPTRPVDKVSIRGENSAAGAANISALTQGLAANYGVAEAGAAKKAESVKPAGPGQASVDLARKFEGQLSQRVKGKLPHFQAAGGKTNNCADFVSSVLQASGRGVTQNPSVSGLRQQLKDKGWQAISPDQAKPGDVWMTKSNTHGSRHTELVSQVDGKGGFHTIGSNNITKRQQKITERPKSGGVIYGYRPPELPTRNPHR